MICSFGYCWLISTGIVGVHAASCLPPETRPEIDLTAVEPRVAPRWHSAPERRSRRRIGDIRRLVSDATRAVEATGAAIMIVGASWALVDYTISWSYGTGRPDAYRELRQTHGSSDRSGSRSSSSVTSFAPSLSIPPSRATVLGLSSSSESYSVSQLEVEIDGAWASNVRRSAATTGTDDRARFHQRQRND